jgi:hypothetical protein
MSQQYSTHTISRKQEKMGEKRSFAEKERVLKNDLEMRQGFRILKQNRYMKKGLIVEPSGKGSCII